jgi:hypothetical protein
MNKSRKTRLELVIDALRNARDDADNPGGWVMTADLENAQVGGTAGTARVREARGRGYVIASRRHPDPLIDQHQYKLISEPGEYDITPDPVDMPYVSWAPERDGFKALLNGAHLQVFASLDRTQWYWTSKGTVKGSGGPGTLDHMKKAAVLAAASHR